MPYITESTANQAVERLSDRSASNTTFCVKEPLQRQSPILSAAVTGEECITSQNMSQAMTELPASGEGTCFLCKALHGRRLICCGQRPFSHTVANHFERVIAAQVDNGMSGSPDITHSPCQLRLGAQECYLSQRFPPGEEHRLLGGTEHSFHTVSIPVVDQISPRLTL